MADLSRSESEEGKREIEPPPQTGGFPDRSIATLHATALLIQEKFRLRILNENRIAQKLTNDAEKGKDQLGVDGAACALAETIAFKSLTPPFVVGILGGWGSGKSYIFNLIKNHLAEIQKKGNRKTYVGHVYTVNFNAWTFAKDHLWSSLMHQVLIDLNCQLELEARFFFKRRKIEKNLA
jgi:hypothetical protein